MYVCLTSKQSVFYDFNVMDAFMLSAYCVQGTLERKVVFCTYGLTEGTSQLQLDVLGFCPGLFS